MHESVVFEKNPSFEMTLSPQAGADPNQQTLPPSPTHTHTREANGNPFDDQEEGSGGRVFRETPLHRAIRRANLDDVTALLDHLGELFACYKRQVAGWRDGVSSIKVS